MRKVLVKMGMLNGMLFVARLNEVGEEMFWFLPEAVEGSEWTDEAAGDHLLLGTDRPNMIKSVCVVGATMGVIQIPVLFVRSGGGRIKSCFSSQKARICCSEEEPDS